MQNPSTTSRPQALYDLVVHRAWHALSAADWDGLCAASNPAGHSTNPFTQYAYLAALETSATLRTGWDLHIFCLHHQTRPNELVAACALYIKSHSYGEYVFDFDWANAYQRHGLAYYPKALVAVPFTPVPGPRLLAADAAARGALLQALMSWCEQQGLSSLHLLFLSEADRLACVAAGLMLRQGVQFHWQNLGWDDFDAFLTSLTKDKRKKIRAERRKVADAGVTFSVKTGAEIASADWDFFYRCYEQTYFEHGNAPYLKRAFFSAMQETMPANWLLFTALQAGEPIACSLIALSTDQRTAYGRYWGALERVDSLHFEACYYQPIAWCIANGVQTFEGGAQGEHKMARALMPTATSSAHWIAHPAFADAIAAYLKEDSLRMENYATYLDERSPFKHGDQPPRSVPVEQ